MDKWVKNIGSTFDRERIVRVDRLPAIDDNIDGYIIGANTRVDFGGGYEEALTLVSEHEATKEK